MKTKVKVSICMGTTCFVMGASELLLFEESIPDAIKEKLDLELEGLTCMEICRNSSHGKPPFAKVNDELLSEASVVSIIEKLSQIAGVP